MTQDLDALPLPVPAIGNGWSAKQLRAARREGYERAKREAQEGREPVAWRIHPHDYGIGSAGVYAITQLPQQKDAWLKKGWAPEPLYTAPPPKSDEARDALIKAARWFADNPDSPKSALGHITEALAALAAQQSKGEAS